MAPWSRLVDRPPRRTRPNGQLGKAIDPPGFPHHLHPERTNVPHIGGRITIMGQESTRQRPTKHPGMGPKRATHLAGLVEAVVRSSTEGLYLVRQHVRTGNAEAARVERDAPLTALEGLIEEPRAIVELVAGGDHPDRDAGLRDLQRRRRVVADEVTGLGRHAALGDRFIDLLDASDCTWRAVLASTGSVRARPLPPRCCSDTAWQPARDDAPCRRAAGWMVDGPTSSKAAWKPAHFPGALSANGSAGTRPERRVALTQMGNRRAVAPGRREARRALG